MTNNDKAMHFFSLHVKGSPLVLYNIWDAGGAKAVAEAGAKAVATGSWSVAAAHGYEDGESIPKDMVQSIVTRIVSSVNVPVTVDFEGAYATEPREVAENVARIMDTGAVGINFEDQIIGGVELYSVNEQCRRIEAIRDKSDALGLKFFINARTDIFLNESDTKQHKTLMLETLERANAYCNAGANGFFAPGLIDSTLIAELCERSRLPINIMASKKAPPNAQLAQIGVARISYGPVPFVSSMAHLQEEASVLLS